MALGPRDVSSLVDLTGWDATVLNNFRLEDGTTYEAIVSMIVAGAGALNVELSSGLWGAPLVREPVPDFSTNFHRSIVA